VFTTRPTARLLSGVSCTLDLENPGRRLELRSVCDERCATLASSALCSLIDIALARANAFVVVITAIRFDSVPTDP
jgi:hypothetical protein